MISMCECSEYMNGQIKNYMMIVLLQKQHAYKAKTSKVKYNKWNKDTKSGTHYVSK
jgi:antitoxin component YwqK of YwqJK toxin-antitoxin module